MLKHIYWRFGRGRGRAAVWFNGEWLEVKSIGGKTLPVEILIPALDAAFPGWRQQAEELFRRRNEPWKIDVHVGMSGCRDYYTRRLVDERVVWIKTTAHVHISMFGKLSEGLEGNVGELAPILSRLQSDYQLPTDDEIEVEVTIPREPKGFNAPWEPSGLLQKEDEVSFSHAEPEIEIV